MLEIVVNNTTLDSTQRLLSRKTSINKSVEFSKALNFKV
jgi:hypothetical protein